MKFLDVMKVKSYLIPVLKIALSILLIALVICRNHFIHINNSIWNTIISVVCFLIVILLVLSIYLSVGEMILINECRAESTLDANIAISYGKSYSIDYVLDLLESNDIIEILIISNKQVIKLGATSDSHPGNSMFFDKCYYIDNQNDITIENLKNRIIDYSINNKICVIAIDGIPPISSNKTPE